MAYDLTVRQWGERLGVSRQRAYKIAKQCGIEIRDGKIDSAEANATWAQKKDHRQADRHEAGQHRAEQQQPATSTEAPLVQQISEAVEFALAEEDTSRGEAQRILEWLRVQEAKRQDEIAAGKLLAADTVESEWTRIAREIRDGVMGIPGRLANRLPTEWRRDLMAAADDEVRQVLVTLSNGIRSDQQAA